MAGPAQPRRGRQPRGDLGPARQAFGRPRRQLAQEWLGLVQQPSVAIHQLLACSYKHRQLFAERIGETRCGALERMRQMGMGLQLAGDRLRVHGVALLPRPGRFWRRSAVLVGQTSRTWAPLASSARASWRPRLLLPSIAQTGFATCSLAQASSASAPRREVSPCQCPTTPPRSSSATALNTRLCGSTPMTACLPVRGLTREGTGRQM